MSKMKSNQPSLQPLQNLGQGTIGYGPGQIYYHCYTGVKPFLSQSMDPWTAIKKALPQCGGDTSYCLGTYAMALVLNFTMVVGWTKNFSHYLCNMQSPGQQTNNFTDVDKKETEEGAG